MKRIASILAAVIALPVFAAQPAQAEVTGVKFTPGPYRVVCLREAPRKHHRATVRCVLVRIGSEATVTIPKPPVYTR